MDGPTLAAIIAASAAIIGPLGTVAANWWARRKLNADATKVLAEADATSTSTMMSLIKPLEERLRSLEADNAALRAELVTVRKQWSDEVAVLHQQANAKDNEIAVMKARISRLEGQISMLGAKPVE